MPSLKWKPNFPIKLKGRVQSQPLLIKLDSSKSGMHIVVPAFDGHVYLIDPISGCSEKLDLGETSYSMVLADDITGNGKMDLVVTTRNGNVYVIGTEMSYNPLLSWTSQTQGRNGFSVREKYQGIYVLEGSRNYHDVTGSNFCIQFEIVDFRKHHKIPPFYEVKIFRGKQQIFKNTYLSPGIYSETLPSPNRKQEQYLR